MVVSGAWPEGRARDGSGGSPDRGRDLARLMAGRGDVLSMSPATGQRRLTAMLLKPHRGRDGRTRTDPEFERKMDEIVHLSLAPPRHRRLRCIDEKPGIPAVDRRYPRVPMCPGQLERRQFESIRHGVVDLFAAFDVRTGPRFGQC